MIDFIECTDNSTCDENALCNNVTGTSMCTCNEGFIGNGTVCEGEYYSQHIFIMRKFLSYLSYLSVIFTIVVAYNIE